MKKRFVPLSMALASGILCSLSVHAQNVITENIADETEICGQIQYENYLRSQDPDFDRKRDELNKVIQERVAQFEQAKQSGTSQPFAQYTIPVVVHVVWNTAAQNVTDAKIISMISQLNKDWSRTNSDAGNTPAVWKPLAVNMEVQFCLATKTPSGTATNGIVRKQTSTTSFPTGNDMKSSATGGDDPWDVTKYYNIWVCNLNSGLLGFAGFPPNPLNNTYGTVVDYCTVGSMTNPGSGCSSYAFSRILTHEIAHSFTLYHQWGGGCTYTDYVADTPTQGAATTGCPAFPQTDACSPGSPGIMFMNYMDYTTDACRNMFTAGQKTRTQSAIATYLMSIANNAATACGTVAVNNISSEDNISLYPNPSTGEVFLNAEWSNNTSMYLKVYNAIGKAVFSKKINTASSKEAKIDMSGSPDGIYLFEIKFPEGTFTRKVIISK